MSDDLASGVDTLGTYTPVQLYAGERPLHTLHHVTTIDVVKYGVYALNANDQVVAYSADATKVVVASQPAVAGDELAFFHDACFNHEALVWPGALATGTLAQRRAAIPAGCFTVNNLL